MGQFLFQTAYTVEKKVLKKGGEVLDREERKVVNYKLPAQITGALFDR